MIALLCLLFIKSSIYGNERNALNCGFGLELNASCNNVKIVSTGEMLFAGKFIRL